MKVNDLSYYAEFVFNSSNGDCFATTDYEMFEFIKHDQSGEKVSSIRIGDVLVFEGAPGEPDKRYEVTDISIRHLFDDTDLMKYGIDLEGCTEMQGEPKEKLFGVLVKMEPA